MRLLSASAMRMILNSVNSLTKVINLIGYATLAGAVLVTAVNVCGRYILKKPLLGEVDMVELGMAVFGGVAMFLTTTKRHHVSVDVLVIRFSRRTQAVLGRIASLLGCVTWGVLAYLVFLDGLERLENGSCTATLRVSQGPFAIALAIGLFLICVTMLIQVFRPEGSVDKKEGGL